MSRKFWHIFIIHVAASVWFVNGYFCKILHLVPRHEQIVGKVLGEQYYPSISIKIIGLLEVCMAVWILSGYKKRLNVYTQIITIAGMNIIEFVAAPELLLWGKWNIVFAAMFILLLYFNHKMYETFRNNSPKEY